MNTHFYRRHRILAPLLVVLALFVADLMISLGGLGLSLVKVRSAARALDRSDLSVGLGDIGRWGGHAEWFVGHPAYRLTATVLPDLAVGAELARAAADVGARASAGYRALGGGRAGSIYRDGRVDIDRLEEAHRRLQEVTASIERHREELASGSRPLIGSVGRAADDALRRLDAAGATAAKVEDLLGSLPQMLGADEPRTYLLVFQSPSEARGGGGLIGVTAELSAVAGRLELGEVRTVRELVDRMRGRVDAPGWFEETYGPLLATREWRTANASPNFPVTSQVVTRMYERSVGKTVDGVIAMDPLTLATLTEATGPLQAKGWDVAITKDNARRVLLHDVYRHFHFIEHRQNRYFAALLDAVWDEIGSGDAGPDALARSLSDSVAKQHLKLFVQDAAAQQALTAVDASGSYDAGEPVQMLFNNNWSANKIDFFLHRMVDVEIELRADLTAEVTTEVTLENRIEDLESNVIARPGVQRDLPLGLNRTLLTLLMPEGATRPRLFIQGRMASPIRGTDGTHPVASQFVDIPAGGRETVVFSYLWPSAVRDGRFDLTLFPQATARPDRMSVAVVDRDGATRLERDLALKRATRIFLRADSAP